MIPVKGHPNLYRDEETGAIINTDSSGFSAYQQAKAKKVLEREELDNMIFSNDYDTAKEFEGDYPGLFKVV